MFVSSVLLQLSSPGNSRTTLYDQEFLYSAEEECVLKTVYDRDVLLYRTAEELCAEYTAWPMSSMRTVTPRKERKRLVTLSKDLVFSSPVSYFPTVCLQTLPFDPICFSHSKQPFLMRLLPFSESTLGTDRTSNVSFQLP